MKFKHIQSVILLLSLVTGIFSFPVRADLKNREDSKLYKGDNMCIAILDRGFHLSHESFILEDESPKLTKEKVNELFSKTLAYSEVGENFAKESDGGEAPESPLYVSEKIPFAYDYGDSDTDLSQELFSAHGTAMISIAASTDSLGGNSAALLRGVAPKAQILAMKVFSDKLGTTSYKAMANAINDAVILGADVIYIAVTQIGGFSSSGHAELEAAIDNAFEKGIIIISPAGDIMQYGSESVFYREESVYGTPTDNPDIGTVAYPSSSPKVISVGSADTNEILSDCFILADGTKIPYADSNYFYSIQESRKTFLEHFDGKTLEYVVCDGVGTKEQLSVLGDLRGKIVIVNRGDITFVEKAKNAAEAQAAGLIVVDNQSSEATTLETNLDLSETPIPVIIIPNKAAASLRYAAQKSISFKVGTTCNTIIRETPKISSYSAYGTTMDLGLKPDVTAWGSNVKCALPNDEYSTISSTTAAAARVAGICAGIKEYLISKSPELTGLQLADRVRGLLINSAELMIQNSDSPYSPRVQGAGSASLERALGCDILLSSKGKFKVELGEGNRRLIEFEITAENLSDFAKVCTLDGFVGTYGYEEYKYSEFDTNTINGPLWERMGASPDTPVYFTTAYANISDADIFLGDGSYRLNAASENYSPYTFKLEGGQRQTFSIKIYVHNNVFNDCCEKFKNGFFIEGFMRLSDAEHQVSVPYVSFFGDFDKDEALDADIYGDLQAIYDYRYLYTEKTNSGIISDFMLGASGSDSGVYYDGSEITFASKNFSSVKLNLGLRRSIEELALTVTDSDKNVIEEKKYLNLPRSYVNSVTGALISPNIEIWNGRDSNNLAYIYPDGEYEITLKYKRVAGDREKSFSYTLKIDNTAPKITASVKKRDRGYILETEIVDISKISEVAVFDSEFVYTAKNPDGSFDISSLWGEYIYVEAVDLAGNKAVIRLDNPRYLISP